MAKKIELHPNEKYGRLTVLYFSHRIKGKPFWMCRCDCGTVKAVQPHQLKVGRTKSCGCLRRENARRSRDESKGWANLNSLPIKSGGRTIRELAEIVGVTHQCINQVEQSALEKLGRGLLKLGISSVDIQHFKHALHSDPGF